MIKKYAITDIAADLNVSCSTVSKALSNSPGVSEKVRARIVEYAHEIGYEPNSRKNQKDSSRIVALFLGDIRNPFYAELTFHIQKALNEAHYMVMIFNTEYRVDKEMEFLQSMQEYRFAGVILMTAQVEKISEQLNELGIPVVLVNRILNSFRGDLVLLDNFKAGYIATMHLIDQGHERIGFVKGHTSSSASRQRYEGYCQAMKNYDLKIYNEFIYYSDMKLEAGEKIADIFLAQNDRPSGLIIINDATALGFSAKCIAAGLSIPEQLSIVSFDNTKYAEFGRVPLTSVDQNPVEMGKKTVELLLDRIKTPSKDTKRIILDPFLVQRESVGPYQK